jgi:hypothetical protein
MARQILGLTDSPLTFLPAVTNPVPDLVKQLIHSNSSLYSDCIIQANSPAPRQLVNLAHVPVLVVTTESSYHAPYDWWTVQFLQQAGVPAQHLKLADIGIHGNGHMVFIHPPDFLVCRQAIHLLHLYPNFQQMGEGKERRGQSRRSCV